MKTKTKTKLKSRAKRIRHLVTKKKLVRRRTSHHVARGFFVFVVTVTAGGMAFAIATTKPTVDIEVRTNLARAIAALNPVTTQAFPSQVGTASWYALGLPAPDNLTCASTKFPRGTYLLVKNTRNNRSVICLVNDYGPEAWTNRAIDLSRGSFSLIDSLGAGTAPVQIWVVPPPPSSFNLPLPVSFSQFLGYNLCASRFSASYCEAHRKTPIKIK